MDQSSGVLGWGSLALITPRWLNIDRRGPLKYLLGPLLLGPFITILLAATREDAGGGLRQLDLWSGRDVAKKTK